MNDDDAPAARGATHPRPQIPSHPIPSVGYTRQKASKSTDGWAHHSVGMMCGVRPRRGDRAATTDRMRSDVWVGGSSEIRGKRPGPYELEPLRQQKISVTSTRSRVPIVVHLPSRPNLAACAHLVLQRVLPLDDVGPRVKRPTNRRDEIHPAANQRPLQSTSDGAIGPRFAPRPMEKISLVASLSLSILKKFFF